MDNKRNQIIADIEMHKNKLRFLEKQLEEYSLHQIADVAESKIIPRVTNHIFVIKFSDMIGRPWNPEFYYWKMSAKIVIKFLQPHPVTEWKERLVDKINNSKQEHVVEFERVVSCAGVRCKHKIPVDKDFIQKIIERL